MWHRHGTPPFVDRQQTRSIAFANYQNGLGWPVLSTAYQTSGVRSSSWRKPDKTFSAAPASIE
ncbi:hypothetical protein OU5_0058 [Pseudomonas mandelii JR-1]|uniref:Uncharacterized protein n=1 Tax=Pseudomonas mandelii JR-1 TaxID=1147786 RepID=A0A024E2W1_9PSED|nr:hypothetical protein OU5_0058 [Pseudomonas mandelii JR-1]